MALRIEKIGQSRRFHHIVEQLQRAILSGEIQPGETLPPEMKLKEMFDTGRGTVREALRMLEQKGLVDIKVGAGGGIVVRDMGVEKITEHLNMLMQVKKVSLDDIASFREGVEGLVAEMAARNATVKDIGELRNKLAEIKKLLNDDNSYWHRFIEIDIEIHRMIAKIAANPIYEAVTEMIHQNILGSAELFSEKSPELLLQNYDDLLSIVDALEKRDAKKAKNLARRHVHRFKDNIAEDLS